MITFSKFKSSSIEAGKRIIKVLQFGPKTAKEAYPFGFDSQPPEDWTAIYAETSNNEESVIIGYINKNQLAGVGESRMYSVDAQGAVMAYVVCDATGRISLSGSTYSAVRFQPLKTAIDNKDALLSNEFAKIAAAIALLGGTYVPGPVGTVLTSSESPTIKLK